MNERRAENCHVPRRAFLAAIGKSAGVAKACPLHAEAFCPLRHVAGKFRFRRRHAFGQNRRGIIRGFRDQCEDGVLDRDAAPSFQAELGRRLSRCARRDREFLVHAQLTAIERLERHVQCHDLGEGGRIKPVVGISGIENLTRAAVHHDRGITCRGRCWQRYHGDREQQQKRAKNAKRRPVVLHGKGPEGGSSEKGT